MKKRLFTMYSSVALAAMTAVPIASAAPLMGDDAQSAKSILLLFMQPDSDGDNMINFDYRAYFSHPCFDMDTQNEMDDCELLFGEQHDLKEFFLSGMLFDVLTNHDWYLDTDDDNDDGMTDGVDTDVDGVIDGMGNRIFDAQTGLYFDPITKRYYKDQMTTVPEMLDWMDNNHQPNIFFDPDTNRYYDRVGGFPGDVYDASVEDDEATSTRDRADDVWMLCGERYGEENQTACYQSNLRLITDLDVSVTRANVYYSPR